MHDYRALRPGRARAGRGWVMDTYEMRMQWQRDEHMEDLAKAIEAKLTQPTLADELAAALEGLVWHVERRSWSDAGLSAARAALARYRRETRG
jgi:hypothetical protein